jgi:hypothetical protein
MWYSRAADNDEACVWSAARQLRVDLATRQGSEMQQVWDRYQSLSQHSLLGVGLLNVRGPLKERLVSQADRVIADYRQDEPAVRGAQWRDATVFLANALRSINDRATLARAALLRGPAADHRRGPANARSCRARSHCTTRSSASRRHPG